MARRCSGALPKMKKSLKKRQHVESCLFLDYYQYNDHTGSMKKIFTILLISFALGACSTSGRTQKEEFIVDPDSPQISIGEIDVQLDKTFPLPGIRKTSVTMNYFPREDAVCLQYRTDLMTYYQFWSRSGRTAFIKALEDYKEDYTARNLDRKGGRRAIRKYGNVEGYLIWQMSKYLTRARAGVNIEIGYSFKDNSPYFTINQRDAHYVSPLSEREVRNAPQIPMYFTRAQADELAVFFDQQYLEGLVSGRVDDNADIEDYYNENETQSENDIQSDEY